MPDMPDQTLARPTTAKDWPLQRDAASFYGRIETGNDGLPMQRWENSNLTQINLPYAMRLSWDTDKVVRKLTCHRSVARDLSQILAEILGHYQTTAAIAEARMDLFGGCYNFRRMRGGAALSMHSYGVAIDLDPENNELGVPWKANAGMMPEAVVAIFERHGWTWGGRWERRADAMHFQAAKV